MRVKSGILQGKYDYLLTNVENTQCIIRIVNNWYLSVYFNIFNDLVKNLRFFVWTSNSFLNKGHLKRDFPVSFIQWWIKWITPSHMCVDCLSLKSNPFSIKRIWMDRQVQDYGSCSYLRNFWNNKQAGRQWMRNLRANITIPIF